MNTNYQDGGDLKILRITELDISTELAPLMEPKQLLRCADCNFQTRSKEVWPSSSPDLNPMDFAIWSVSENKPSRTSYKNLESLKADLVKCWDEIGQEELRRIVGNFERRPRALCGREGRKL